MKREENILFFFLKNVSEPSNPSDELAQKCFENNHFRTNYSSIFSSKVQNLTVFSIIYMIRIRFFGPRELVQRYFSAAQYEHVSLPRRFFARTTVAAGVCLASQLALSFVFITRLVLVCGLASQCHTRTDEKEMSAFPEAVFESTNKHASGAP